MKRPRTRMLRWMSRATAVVLLAPFPLACVVPMSPADLAIAENHAYPGRTKAQVFHATVTALRSQGYEVIVSDAGTGLIKTAPKVLSAVAYGNSYGAVATENAVGWTVGVTPIPGGVGLHADPRGYSGGQGLGPDQMNGAYLERLFTTFYAEIDANLPPPTK